MGILKSTADEHVDGIRSNDHHLIVDLKDDRTISAPRAWYPRLFDASPAQREYGKICAAGYGIDRPDIPKHLLTESLLRVCPAPGWKSAT
jgi:Protein of unknown function (DUF2442)